MTKCLDCFQTMDVDSCSCNTLTLAEKNGWIISRHERSTFHFEEEDGRCHDCGIKHGGIHHYGCDVERCPICGGQLIGCDCLIGKEVLMLPMTSPEMKRLDFKKPVDPINFSEVFSENMRI